MKISIIIPVHNAEAFLEATVSAVFSQSYQDIELILVDDGSVDGSRKIIQKLANFEPRIRFFFSVNMGQCVARNIGLSIATGQYVKFLDADDLMLPWCLESHISVVRSTGAAIVVGRTICCWADTLINQYKDRSRLGAQGNIECGASLIPEEYENPLSLNEKRHFSFNDVLILREIAQKVGGFNPYLAAAEEYDFLFRTYLELGNIKCAYADAPVIVLKRLSNDSLSVYHRQKLPTKWASVCAIQCLEKTVSRQKAHDVYIQKTLINSAYKLAIYAWRHNYRGEAVAIITLLQKMKIRIDFSKITPYYHRLLHKAFGFFIAESILSKMRSIFRNASTLKK
jgi:glycosyltransferase involved in cell wall biosynthesis